MPVNRTTAASITGEGTGSKSEPLLEASVKGSDAVGAPQTSSGTVDEMPPDLRRHIYLLKFIYFLSAFTGSAWGRFGTVYYLGKGLSDSQIGLLEGCIPAVQVIAMPFWGIVSDKIRSRKKIQLLTIICSTAILMLLAFPNIADGFDSILAITLCMSMFVSTGILDAHTLDVLGKKYFHLYGRIRMMASIAWGIGALTMGYINDSIGFTANFGIYAGLSTAYVITLALCIPEKTATELETRTEEVYLRDFFKALVKPKMLFFLFQIALMGAGMSVVERLLFIYIKDELGGSTLLCGIAVAVTVLFELPIFWYAKDLLHKFGHHGMFALSMVAQLIRLFGYTVLTEDTRWYILCLEILHGVTFACMWTAAVEYAKGMVPKQWASSAQSTLSATLGCVGGGTGAIIGGYVMEHHGGKYMYRGAGFILSGALVVHILYMLITKSTGRETVAQINSGSDEQDSIPQSEESAGVNHAGTKGHTGDKDGDGAAYIPILDTPMSGTMRSTPTLSVTVPPLSLGEAASGDTGALAEAQGESPKGERSLHAQGEGDIDGWGAVSGKQGRSIHRITPASTSLNRQIDDKSDGQQAYDSLIESGEGMSDALDPGR